MFQRIKYILKQFDYVMILILMCLSVISFFSIYSAVYDVTTGNVQDHPYKQLKVLGAAMVCFATISFIGYKRFIKYAPALYAAGCGLLLMVLIMGYEGMGAQRWISIGPFSGQPSEFFKWIWIVMLAWIFSDLQASNIGFLKLMKKFIWVIPPFLLVFKQPDLGTATTYLAVWGIVVLFLGVKRVIIALTIVLVIILTPIMWGHLEPYQKKRVLTFLDPERDPGGAGYQAIQSKIAIGSGGLTGKGYLKGTQSHLKFMPERHTDFIFSVINEEFGFVGGGLIIFLFFVLISRILFLAVSVRNAHGKVICVAAAGLILFQFYVNISMTMGIAPVVGVPLPFISYGGSSLLTFVSILGLVNSVYVRRDEE